MSVSMQRTFEAIGTSWQLDYTPPAAATFDPNQLDTRLHQLLNDFDQRYSRFRPDSWVSQLAGQAGTHVLPIDALPLLQLYHQLYLLTGGLFTPLVGQLLVAAGYDSQYSLQPQATPQSVPAWETVLAFDQQQLRLLQPVLLDFGAAGKGYLVDLVAALLNQQGIKQYTIDAGGDIRHQPMVDPNSADSHFAGQFVRVGLEDPADSRRALGVVELQCQSLAGSAGNRRAWGEWHHIVHPRLLASVRTVTATWVMVEESAHPYPSLLADALATALFLVEPAVLASEFAFAYVIYLPDGTVKVSSNFRGEIFS